MAPVGSVWTLVVFNGKRQTLRVFFQKSFLKKGKGHRNNLQVKDLMVLLAPRKILQEN